MKHQSNTTKIAATSTVTQTANNVKSGMTDLMETVCKLYTQLTPDERKTDRKFADALTSLGDAVAYSVLNKCIDPQRKTGKTSVDASGTTHASESGVNPSLVALKRGLYYDRKNLAALEMAENAAYALKYNKQGDLVNVVADASARDASATLCTQALTDGVDLSQEAIAAVLAELARQTERGEAADLECTYTDRRFKTRVRIKDSDSKSAWEDVETTPVQEVYRTVRRLIANSRAMSTDPRNGYTYISTLETDGETGETATGYRRLTKYADLGGYATDFNGACTYYTANETDVDTTDTMLAALKLTKKQMQVLNLKRRGYGNKAIATYIGVTESSVKGAVNNIRIKAHKAGYDPAIQTLSDKLNGELAKLYKELDRLYDERPTARRTYANINADIDRLNERIDELCTTLDELNTDAE